jgi:hypothetical protein
MLPGCNITSFEMFLTCQQKVGGVLGFKTTAEQLVNKVFQKLEMPMSIQFCWRSLNMGVITSCCCTQYKYFWTCTPRISIFFTNEKTGHPTQALNCLDRSSTFIGNWARDQQSLELVLFWWLSRVLFPKRNILCLPLDWWWIRNMNVLVGVAVAVSQPCMPNCCRFH